MKHFSDMTIQVIKKRLWNDEGQLVNENLSKKEILILQKDSRAGVRKLVETWLRQHHKERAEDERMEQLWLYERSYVSQGYQIIAGVDEAGRGPLAGPVVAGAAILPIGVYLKGLNDSKQLTAEQRESLFHQIRETAVSVGIGIVDAGYIDTYNILQATYEAMRRAVSQLYQVPDLLLNDAVTIPGIQIQQKPIIKGDAKSHSIAAASVLAKVTRDRMMMEYGRMYPEYGFERHMGYGTSEHLAALQQYGPCPIHRQSFAPVSSGR